MMKILNIINQVPIIKNTPSDNFLNIFRLLFKYLGFIIFIGYYFSKNVPQKYVR